VTAAACWRDAQRHGDDAGAAGVVDVAVAVTGRTAGSMQARYPVPHAVVFANLAAWLDLQQKNTFLLIDLAEKQNCCMLLPTNTREILVLPPTPHMPG
jgi:hypothetical protein